MLVVRNMFNKLSPLLVSVKPKPGNRYTSQNNIPTLYGDEVSPPVRFVMMTASHLAIELKFQKIDLFLGENRSENYTKINPLQKVPALCTGDQVICDSHAISLYLCRKSGNNDLYPEDMSMRARVDQLLFFNSSLLFPADSTMFSDFFAGIPIDEAKVDKWNKLMNHLDMHLNSQPWLAGNKMLLCDLCCGATVSSMQLLVPLADHHIGVARWMNRLQQQICFANNSGGLNRLANFIKKQNSNKSI